MHLAFKACNEAFPINGMHPEGLADEFHSQCVFYSVLLFYIYQCVPP